MSDRDTLADRAGRRALAFQPANQQEISCATGALAAIQGCWRVRSEGEVWPCGVIQSIRLAVEPGYPR
jgi:hypothetical protein